MSLKSDVTWNIFIISANNGLLDWAFYGISQILDGPRLIKSRLYDFSGPFFTHYTQTVAAARYKLTTCSFIRKYLFSEQEASRIIMTARHESEKKGEQINRINSKLW